MAGAAVEGALQNPRYTLPLLTVSRTPTLTNRAGAGAGALVQFGGSGTVYYALVIALVLYMQVVRGTKVHALPPVWRVACCVMLTMPKITPGMEVAIHLIWLPPAFLLALLPLANPGDVHYDNSGTNPRKKFSPHVA